MNYQFDKRKISRINRAPAVQNDPAGKAQLPNSLVMRIMKDPAAEKEADRLSRGITSKTPGDLMAEMGSRLGADFSDVQFHSDTTSMNRSKALGARAWAQGRDVHFGKGGFDPQVAAHELVHTVQQGAVQGDVSQSVPNGSVQLFQDEDENAIQRRPNITANASNLELMIQQKNSSDYGRQLFINLKKPVKQLAECGGSRISALNEDNTILYLANLGERDYSGKEILRDIATRSVINKDERYERTDEYKGFLDYMKGRTNKVGLETVAMQTQVLDGNPRFNHDNDQNLNKRAYEMTAQELAGNTFNPNHDAEIAQVIRKIENAQTPSEAFHRFLEYTEGRRFTNEEIANSGRFVNFAHQPIPYMKDAHGNDADMTEAQVNQHKRILAPIEKKIKDAENEMEAAQNMENKLVEGSPWREKFRQDYDTAKAKKRAAKIEKRQKGEIQYRYQQGADINTPLLKAKLKNMVRQIRDYPELRHKIGGINIMWNQKEGAYREETDENVMAVTTSPGAREKATIHYDAWQDRDTPEGQQDRTNINNNLSRGIGHLDKVGNHELGHVLESTLNPTEDDQSKGVASNSILQSVLPKVMTHQEQAQVNYNAQNGKNAYKKNVYAGQIDTTSPIFRTKRMTSGYGQSMPKEWFAEAFHDVYTKGADAKPTSIEIVKEYERRQTAKQKAGFRKKEAGFFTKIGRAFSRLFNFGARHNAPQPAAQNAIANPMAQMPDLHNIHVNQNAGIPQGNNAVNANPVPDDESLSHYEGNLLHDNDPLDRLNQRRNEEEDLLNQSIITVRPKKRKLRKKN